MDKFIYVFDEESKDLLISSGLKQLPCASKCSGNEVFVFVLEGEIPDSILSSDCTYMLSNNIVL